MFLPSLKSWSNIKPTRNMIRAVSVCLEAVVRPANAEEIAAVVKLCNKYNVPLTVRSGGTSLADGAIAVCGGIVLLMERLNKIIEMNTEAMYVVAEAGVRTVDIQKMANEAGYLYAGDPCSASCTIGGNLATNAGGSKAVRYGVTRNQSLQPGDGYTDRRNRGGWQPFEKMQHRLLHGAAGNGQ